jgi:hypothetical protein
MLANYVDRNAGTMSKPTTIAICAALTGLLLATPPSAQAQPSSAQRDAIRQSCRSDFIANCSGVQPGGKDALQCLQHNMAKLSPACQTAVHAVTSPAKPEHQPAAAAPATPPPAPSKAAVAPPVASPPAAPTVAPLKLRAFILPRRRLAIAGICAGDVSRLCQGVPPGEERVLKCLAARAAELTSQCYDAIARVSER